jgi:hypothetical protein
MTPRRGIQWLVGGVSTAVLAAIIAGLAVVGSPAHQRALRLDTLRTGNLGMLSARVYGYWASHKQLPATLDQLGPGAMIPVDPVSGRPYGYSVTGASTYKLCAHFDAAWEPEGNPSNGFIPGNASRWSHPQGDHCFELDARSNGMAGY